MNFFWPRRANVECGAVGRLGRVVHWMSLAVGFGAAALALAPGTDPTERWLFVALGGLIALAGRGVRYVFAAE